MGNGAVSNDGVGKDYMDQEVQGDTQAKPGTGSKSYDSMKDEVMSDQGPGAESQPATPAANLQKQASEQGTSESKDAFSPKTISKGKAAAAQSIKPTEEDDEEEEDDVEPVAVLLQFIPYYGQGDPSNDSIVRSTLSGLSVEDIDSQDEYGNTLLLLAW
jgi:hypothetical protein